MNQIFLILLLYIIFGVVGPIIKRLQQAQQAPPPQTPDPREPRQPAAPTAFEANVEKYFTRLQDVFQQSPAQPSSGREAAGPPPQSKLRSAPAQSEHAAPDDVLPPPLPVAPRKPPSPYRLAPARRQHPQSVPQPKSLLTVDSRRGYIQGILMAEILGPPVSKRPKPS